MTDAEKVERLYGLQKAVEDADEAWFEALKVGLPAKDEKAVYKAAKAEFRAYESDLLAQGTQTTCGRCGGKGVVDYGRVVLEARRRDGSTVRDRFCFECGGAKVTSLRPHTFSSMAPTRWKRAQEHAAKEAAQKASESEAWSKFETEHPDVAAFLSKHERPDDDYPEDGFLTSMYENVLKWGGLTDKQMAAVRRSMTRMQSEADSQAKLAAGAPFPHGKQTVEGEIVSVTARKNAFGASVWKALVVLTSGHKVWGTCSEKFWAAAEERSVKPEDLRVRFTATFEQSADDEGFGFFKSPSRIEVLGLRGVS